VAVLNEVVKKLNAVVPQNACSPLHNKDESVPELRNKPSGTSATSCVARLSGLF
jgi:hypothetical protein